jgi:hypothetical protein
MDTPLGRMGDGKNGGRPDLRDFLLFSMEINHAGQAVPLFPSFSRCRPLNPSSSPRPAPSPRIPFTRSPRSCIMLTGAFAPVSPNISISLGNRWRAKCGAR